jgi:uncharacterized protein (TIGR01244 family)
MLIHPLSNQLSVAAQIEPADVATLAVKGFRGIINNRPDGEEADQPSSAMLAAAATQAGLDYRYIPVVTGQLQQAHVQAFTSALTDMHAPVLAFCRTGTRSSILWALQAPGTADAILDSASAAGYDLSALRPRLGNAARGH